MKKSSVNKFYIHPIEKIISDYKNDLQKTEVFQNGKTESNIILNLYEEILHLDFTDISDDIRKKILLLIIEEINVNIEKSCIKITEKLKLEINNILSKYFTFKFISENKDSESINLLSENADEILQSLEGVLIENEDELKKYTEISSGEKKPKYWLILQYIKFRRGEVKTYEDAIKTIKNFINFVLFNSINNTIQLLPDILIIIAERLKDPSKEKTIAYLINKIIHMIVVIFILNIEEQLLENINQKKKSISNRLLFHSGEIGEIFNTESVNFIVDIFTNQICKFLAKNKDIHVISNLFINKNSIKQENQLNKKILGIINLNLVSYNYLNGVNQSEFKITRPTSVELTDLFPKSEFKPELTEHEFIKNKFKKDGMNTQESVKLWKRINKFLDLTPPEIFDLQVRDFIPEGKEPTRLRIIMSKEKIKKLFLNKKDKEEDYKETKKKEFSKIQKSAVKLLREDFMKIFKQYILADYEKKLDEFDPNSGLESENKLNEGYINILELNSNDFSHEIQLKLKLLLSYIKKLKTNKNSPNNH